MGTLIFDIDGTICSQEIDYSKAQPFQHIIQKINKKYDEGYHITFFTARGTKTGINWEEITRKQLNDWKVKYHDLYFGKPDGTKCGYYIYKSDKCGFQIARTGYPNIYANGVVAFKEKEHVEQAIKMLGDELKYLFEPW